MGKTPVSAATCITSNIRQRNCGKYIKMYMQSYILY